MLEILHEDANCIIVNKPASIPTQPDKTNDASALDIVTKHLKRQVFVVNRLDRPASGVLVFAKSSNSAGKFSALFQSDKIDKKYWVIVKNKPKENSGTLEHYLKKGSKSNKSLVFEDDKKGGKKAVLKYEVLKSLDNYHLLEIQLKTGRFHQIRSQLAAIGSPIKGDVKYGARRSNSDRSIHLHARNISFIQPFNNQEINVEAAPPSDDSIWQAVSF
ncbi:MAG: RNA pseudouridine synthase [Saprospiraceae bacterium]|nr:RNA pseudouridine synthase [Saprospiraceae bacterium]